MIQLAPGHQRKRNHVVQNAHHQERAPDARIARHRQTARPGPRPTAPAAAQNTRCATEVTKPISSSATRIDRNDPPQISASSSSSAQARPERDFCGVIGIGLTHQSRAARPETCGKEKPRPNGAGFYRSCCRSVDQKLKPAFRPKPIAVLSVKLPAGTPNSRRRGIADPDVLNTGLQFETVLSVGHADAHRGAAVGRRQVRLQIHRLAVHG